MRVLLTYATRSLALRIVNLLPPEYEVQFATCEEVPSVFQSRYKQIPHGESPTYVHEVLKSALDTGCTMVLPLGLEEVRSLAASHLLFEEYNIKLLSPQAQELSDMEILVDVPPKMSLSLVKDHINLFTKERVNVDINGIGIISDDGYSFILTLIK